MASTKPQPSVAAALRDARRWRRRPRPPCGAPGDGRPASRGRRWLRRRVRSIGLLRLHTYDSSASSAHQTVPSRPDRRERCVAAAPGTRCVGAGLGYGLIRTQEVRRWRIRVCGSIRLLPCTGRRRPPSRRPPRALESDAPPAADPLEQHSSRRGVAGRGRACWRPGWLGAPLDAQSATTPLGGVYPPQFVRLGVAQPLDDARFPAVVPLLGTGHLTVDASVQRRAGLRADPVRAAAAAGGRARPGRCWSGRWTASAGARSSRRSPMLADAGLMSPTATDRAGLRDVLAEAEKWLRPVRGGAAPRRSGATG